MFEKCLPTADDQILSVYGTLFLDGAMAAARANDSGSTHSFISEAADAADRLGQDSNHPAHLDAHGARQTNEPSGEPSLD